MAGTRSPDTAERTSARLDMMWLLAVVSLVVGLLAAASAWSRSLHAVSTVGGAVSAPLGLWAQMFSAHTNQRWAAIIGVVAGGFGLAMGVARGGV